MGEIKFMDGCFTFSNAFTDDCLSAYQGNLKIIGNIFENKD
jgi:hypothetical protein